MLLIKLYEKGESLMFYTIIRLAKNTNIPSCRIYNPPLNRRTLFDILRKEIMEIKAIMVDCQLDKIQYLCLPKKKTIQMEDQGEIILYQPDSEVKLEVRLEEETVWLTQMQMAELFQTSKQNVSLHTNNIFKENELDRNSVVKESLTTASDGKKYRVRYFNLDVIISVGYRVKSIRGTQFRQWANSVLKEYLLKGYSMPTSLPQT